MVAKLKGAIISRFAPLNLSSIALLMTRAICQRSGLRQKFPTRDLMCREAPDHSPHASAGRGAPRNLSPSSWHQISMLRKARVPKNRNEFPEIAVRNVD